MIGVPQNHCSIAKMLGGGLSLCVQAFVYCVILVTERIAAMDESMGGCFSSALNSRARIFDLIEWLNTASLTAFLSMSARFLFPGRII